MAIMATEVEEAAGLARPLRSDADLGPLVDAVGDARFVLVGEASHGTSEYYRWRAALTRRLVEEKGFSFVAVEGDWPDCAVVNRWVKGRGPDRDGPVRDVLRGFDRWPTWMWANEEVATFLDWLRTVNDARPPGRRTGFYGIDVYSLWDSMRVVLDYLAEREPGAVDAAHRAFRCFEPYGEDPQRYATATRMVPTSCEEDVVRLLLEVRRTVGEGVADGDPEAALDAEQNAEVLAGAERYYRTMVRGDGESWNVRDCHMADTLDRLVRHHGPGAKAVVWEHNTHVGDARATDMAAWGMVNVGQLVRERHAGDGVALVGMGGYEGSVIAAPSWGAPARRMDVPAAPPGAHEAVLHEATDGRDGLVLFPPERRTPWLGTSRGHRAIGVVYRPAAERRGNWVPTVLGERYDAFLYFDRTQALTPLADKAVRGEEEETYPFGV